MGISSWFLGLFSSNSFDFGNHDCDIVDSFHDPFENCSTSNFDLFLDDNSINPANGLPMIGGTGGVDIEGNPFGTDFSHDDSFASMDDSFTSGCSFDDW